MKLNEDGLSQDAPPHSVAEAIEHKEDAMRVQPHAPAKRPSSREVLTLAETVLTGLIAVRKPLLRAFKSQPAWVIAGLVVTCIGTALLGVGVHRTR